MKLSIIVPIYKVEAYLRRCIDSILAQTFTDYELILVDDGSPDNCGKICDEYALLDSRIKVIHKENGGLADARNAGIEVAQGEYFGFVDSDDCINPRMYERMLELALEYGAQMVSCGILMLDQLSKVFGQWPELTHDRVYDRESFIDNLYPHVRTDFTPSVCNKLFHRNVFHGIRFPLGRIYEDSFVQLALLDHCNTVVLCHEHFYHYYFSRQDSLMNAPYYARCMDLIDFALINYHFYVDKGLKKQQEYTLSAYSNNYLQNFFEVMLFHKELRPQFRPYVKQFKLLIPQIMRNPQICRLKRFMIQLSRINAKVAYLICKKYFPECLYSR